jgi:ubiquinone/menaquinone biosynthesis C-methylase UbiE
VSNSSEWIIIALVVASLSVVGLLAYWQLIVAEGAYLGTRIVALLYDWFAPHYDRVKQYDKTSDAVMLAQPVLRHLAANHRRQGTVLDVGTGTGRLPAALFAQPRFAGTVVAIDASSRMLELAQAKLVAHGGRIAFMQRDAQRLPFNDGAFDVVTCLEALEFMRDWRGAAADMLRVLRPGGLLMVSNRIGPDAWKLPGRAVPTDDFIAWLSESGLEIATRHEWLVDYDLIFGIKSAARQDTADA